MLGASLEGIYTVVMYRGYKVITKIVAEIDRFMRNKKCGGIRDIIGIASPHVADRQQFVNMIVERQVPRDALILTIDPEKCSGCGKCTVCAYSAMGIEDRIARVDLHLCERWCVCESTCPNNAIAITESA